MYLEGLLLAGIVSVVTKPSKWAIPLIVLLWPIALPFLTYKTFLKYHPLIKEMQQNPLISTMLGLNLPQQGQSPVAAILGASSQPQVNPFEMLANQITSRMQEEDSAYTEETTSEDINKNKGDE